MGKLISTNVGILPVEDRDGRRCFCCDKSLSVRYKVELENGKVLPCCNRCVLKYFGDIGKEIDIDVH